MKIEIIKEFSPEQNRFFHYVYLDGEFQCAKTDLEDAKEAVKVIKRTYLNPVLPETVYTEEF